MRFKNYGGSGIKVCDRWTNSFENFFTDMGERSTGTTLGRYADVGNYEPSNCKWMSRAEQEVERKKQSQ